MHLYYNRKGEKCDVYDFVEAMEGGPDGNKVAVDYVGEIMVSTVFLGIDHNWEPDGKPILFETMIFGGPLDQECWRYCTEEEAVKGHADVLAFVRSAESS